MNPFIFLFRLYLPICTAVIVGAGVSYFLGLPLFKRRFNRQLNREIPTYLGKFLFLIGVPLSIVNFLHRADLSGSVIFAPLVAWSAILLALLCSRLWVRPHRREWPHPSQGSFSLSSMFGNTGYIGFPVVLLLPQLGPDYFGWALFYDVLGTLLGAYVLGVILAAQFGAKTVAVDGPPVQPNRQRLAALVEVVKNPTILAFFTGLALRPVVFPELLDITLNGFAWLMVMLALTLMGMRLQQLNSWGNLKPASIAVGIKMFLIPLVVGMTLTSLGVDGPPRLIMVLQSGMPCAFATLVLSETYHLDRDLAVTSVGLSSVVLLLMLPLWLWGFCTW